MAELVITSHVDIAVDDISEEQAQLICDAVANAVKRVARYSLPRVMFCCTYSAQVTEGSYHEKDILPGPVMPF